ncbi:LysE/ArgO family amino acid transporter [Albidovulum sp.]|uniref:LysE/ArgO family amino acid transporter n=1 Tax=Albidovulum sp. TaxID=1872424 RepID=UPI0039B955DC
MSFAFLAGFQLSLGLIAAIGAQNAFVLRQGLRREHVLAVCLFCAVSDAVLISAGVAGFGTLSRALPAAGEALRWGGVAFLLWYGARAFRAAWRGGEALHAAEAGAARLPGVLAALALITWANPHVWLDTVVLIGSVSARYPGQSASFGAGAALASFVFFFALGYGARLLAPLFARPRAWQVLDAAVGVIMWTIALRLALG